jgi:hypothetical protein
MRTALALSLSAALSLILTAPASPQDCSGTPGYTLDIPDEVAVGDSFSTCITAPPSSFVLVFISASTSPHPTMFGTLCVDLPFLTIWGFAMPVTGSICLDHPVECDASVIGFTGYFQAVALGPNPGQAGLTNLETLTAIDDGSCGCLSLGPGDFVTYTQGGWGSTCSGQNPGCLRDANFASVFPNGLLIGDQDGADGDGFFSLLLTDSMAVEDFLPAGGTSGALTADLVDPLTSPAGVLAGQLVAAKLNVAFDDAGIFDPIKEVDGRKLGNLVIIEATEPKLEGFTVNELIALADKAISGELAEPIDVDNDGIGDVTLEELADALGSINENFDNGTVDNEVLCDC